MAGEAWATMPFDEAVQLNPSVPMQRGVVYPFVGMKAIDPGSRGVVPSEMRKYTAGGSRFMAGDTLMARITPCLENGKIARYVPEAKQVLAHGSTEFIIVRGRPNVTDNSFAYYLTKWDSVRAYCISQMTGSSGRQRVPTNALSHWEVTIPPIQEQQAIACILGVLDDKIELNRRMNKTLEGIAREIFKSWFVDFDPVRAKQGGQEPSGLAPHIADLFPDGFEASQLGPIPAGWRVDTILTIGELVSGGTPSTKVSEYWNGDVKWVSAKDVRAAHGVFVLDTERTITKEGVDNSSTKILPELTTIVTARGTVGSYCILADPMAMNQTNYGLKARSQDADYFVFFTLGSLISQLKQRAHGTIFDTVTTRTFEASQIVVPGASVVAVFDQHVRPLMERIRQNLRQSRTLAGLRDAILPKLISGELRVPDAERIIGRYI